MGCDIHMYQEYRRKNSERKDWSGLGGRINPGRNYYIFGLLAGVRMKPDGALEPKGLPDDMAYESKDDAYLYISESGGEDCATLEQAKKWEGYGNKIIYRDEKPIFVEHPDWHSHSWLTLIEFKEVMEKFKKAAEKDNYNVGGEIEYEAIIASLERLQELGQETRIVFWFDN